MQSTDQLDKLIEILAKVADGLEHSNLSKYTITGAADWPILLFMGGILLAVIGFMWRDLRSTITDHRTDNKNALDSHTRDNKEAIDMLWNECRSIRVEMGACKEKCWGVEK
jgi:hypothetical protein